MVHPSELLEKTLTGTTQKGASTSSVGNSVGGKKQILHAQKIIMGIEGNLHVAEQKGPITKWNTDVCR